jgi:hypothetical protein
MTDVDYDNQDFGALVKSHYVFITLTDDEMDLGEQYGKEMFANNKLHGRIDENSSEEAEIAWVRSEIAVAHWAKIPYDNPDGKFTRVPDVQVFDVRWIKEQENSLVLKKKDPNDRAIISVAGTGRDLILRGWELSSHIRQWRASIALRTKEPMYNKDDQVLYPWKLLKPMYLLSRNLDDYKACYACDGKGITKKFEPCNDCPLGKSLANNPEAFNQLTKYLRRLK